MCMLPCNHEWLLRVFCAGRIFPGSQCTPEFSPVPRELLTFSEGGEFTFLTAGGCRAAAARAAAADCADKPSKLFAAGPRLLPSTGGIPSDQRQAELRSHRRGKGRASPFCSFVARS